MVIGNYLASEPEQHTCCTIPYKPERLMGSLAETTFRIRADKVEVSVKVLFDRSSYPDGCNCLEPLVKRIAQMATKR
jgi:hypothetical protein